MSPSAGEMVGEYFDKPSVVLLFIHSCSYNVRIIRSNPRKFLHDTKIYFEVIQLLVSHKWGSIPMRFFLFLRGEFRAKWATDIESL